MDWNIDTESARTALKIRRMIDVKQDQMSRTFDASAHMLDVQSLTSSSETDSRCDFLGKKLSILFFQW